MWRRPKDEDFHEEFEAHIEIETQQLMEGGLSREAAEGQARRSFGNRTRAAENARETWGFVWLGQIVQDLRYAARTLRHSRGFTAVAVLSLALGIGASTTVFSVADTVFLRPLPYPHPEQLVWVATPFSSGGRQFVLSPDYAVWRRDNEVFQQLAAAQSNWGGVVVMHSPEPTQVWATRVSANFLATLGINPVLGRAFLPEEELPNGPKAVILTDHVWRAQFQSKRDVIGRTITLDAQPFTIVGVLPESFVFPLDHNVDLLTTLPVPPPATHSVDHKALTTMAAWAVIGRLKPGVPLSRAKANVEALFAPTKADLANLYAGVTPIVKPLHEQWVGDAHLLLFLFLGAVVCLLLICCANVANLLLARWATRSRELALRAAIGAGRARLLRQLLTETVLLAAAGCLLGVVFTAVALRAFVYFATAELPRHAEVVLDGRVFAIAVAVTSLTTLLFGLLPALRAGRTDIQNVLNKAGQRAIAGGHRGLRRALVATEISLSLLLLSGAALLLQTLWNLEHNRLGFQPDNVTTVTIPLNSTYFAGSRRGNLADGLLAHVHHLPGTVAASMGECSPLGSGSMGIVFSRSERPLPKPFSRGESVDLCGVGPDYFAAIGGRIVRGRPLTASDYDHPGTLVIVNEAVVRAHFPGEDPLGKQVMGTRRGEWKTIVGVAADMKNNGLDQSPAPQMFVNDVSIYDRSPLVLVVRSVPGNTMLDGSIREKLHALDPTLYAKFETIDQTISTMAAGPRFHSIVIASFAAVAFLIAILGIYGVLAFGVSQRTQEIGVRMALGARPRQILALVLREGTALLVAGTIAGLTGTLLLIRYLKPLLYDVTPTDPRTLIAVSVSVAAAALLAMWLPAQRASAIHPVDALRHE